MRTQREMDILKEEQRRRVARIKEAFLKQFMGERYQELPPAPRAAEDKPRGY